jgi:hypothetical protein
LTFVMDEDEVCTVSVTFLHHMGRNE